jgi:hypothetical protein
MYIKGYSIEIRVELMNVFDSKYVITKIMYLKDEL